MAKIRFEPTIKQFEAWGYLSDKTTTEIGYGGAANCGKTWLGAFWIASHCEAYNGTAWLIGRRELKNLKRTTLLTFFKMAEHFGWKSGQHFEYSYIEGLIKWHNGSKIFLMDLAYEPSDPLFLRLGGLELTGAWVDESNEVDQAAIDILKTRLGRANNDKYGIPPKLLETFNPNKKHVYFRYYKPFRENKMPSYRAFIPALPTDNPYTTQEYIEQLKRADEVTKQRLLFGNFEYDDDPARLFDHEMVLDLFTNQVARGEDRYMTIDVARKGADATVFTIWKGLSCRKVIRKEKMLTDEVVAKAKVLEANWQIRRSHVVVDEDGVGGGVVDHLKGCVGFVNNSKAIRPTGMKEVPNYANLKAQVYFEFARLTALGKISVEGISEADKVLLIEDLGQIRQKDIDKDGKISLISKDEMKESLGRSTDIADALAFRFYFELKKSVKITPFFV